MFPRLLTAAIVSFFAYSAFAADVEIAPPTTDLSKAVAGKYVLDANHTSITFKLTHMGLSNYTGRFDKISGDLVFDTKDPTKSALNVAIDPMSVNVNHEKLSKEIATKEDAFNAVKFPNITFVSKSIVKTSDTTGKITGDLTFMGVTKPVVLDTVFIGAGMNPFTKKPKIGFSATGEIKRGEFGSVAWASMIGDDVHLVIETEFDGE